MKTTLRFLVFSAVLCAATLARAAGADVFSLDFSKIPYAELKAKAAEYSDAAVSKLNGTAQTLKNTKSMLDAAGVKLPASIATRYDTVTNTLPKTAALAGSLKTYGKADLGAQFEHVKSDFLSASQLTSDLKSLLPKDTGAALKGLFGKKKS